MVDFPASLPLARRGELYASTLDGRPAAFPLDGEGEVGADAVQATHSDNYNNWSEGWITPPAGTLVGRVGERSGHSDVFVLAEVGPNEGGRADLAAAHAALVLAGHKDAADILATLQDSPLGPLTGSVWGARVPRYALYRADGEEAHLVAVFEGRGLLEDEVAFRARLTA